MSTVQIDLAPDLDNRIREEAQRRGLSPSEVIRLSLESFFPAPTHQTGAVRNVMEFAGIGRGGWQGVDIDRHIDDMRDEWDQSRD